MSDSGGLTEKSKIDELCHSYGLASSFIDNLSKKYMLKCKFCLNYETVNASIAEKSFEVQVFRAPFTKEKIVKHLELYHKALWEEYQLIEAKEKTFFFGDQTLEELMASGKWRENKVISAFHQSKCIATMEDDSPNKSKKGKRSLAEAISADTDSLSALMAKIPKITCYPSQLEDKQDVQSSVENILQTVFEAGYVKGYLAGEKSNTASTPFSTF